MLRRVDHADEGVAKRVRAGTARGVGEQHVREGPELLAAGAGGRRQPRRQIGDRAALRRQPGAEERQAGGRLGDVAQRGRRPARTPVTLASNGTPLTA